MILINQRMALQDPRLISFCEDAVSQEYEFFAGAYPRFMDWFTKRALPGIALGERTVVLEQRSGRVVAFLILKHTSNEQKLCTLRVREELQKRGIGIRLFEIAFEILKTDKPLLSVADVNLGAFEKIFRYFNFANRGMYRDLYRPNSTEYSFNGDLLNPVQIQRTFSGPRAETVVSKGFKLFGQFEPLSLIV